MISANRGPLLMIAATLSFTLMIGLVKWISGDGLTTLELIFWRSLVSLPPVMWVVGRRLVIRRKGLMLLRSVLGTMAMFCFFTAASGLPIGELSVLVKIQPPLLALAAPMFFGRSERADWTVWVAIALGLCGTICLVAPEVTGVFAGKMVFISWGVAAAVCSTGAHLALRGLAKTEDSSAVVLWFQVAVGLFACIGLGFQDEVHLPTWGQLGILVPMGLFAAMGQMLMTMAYQAEKAPRVAAAGYMAPLFGFLLDAVVFQLMPVPLTLLGASLVIIGGLVLVLGKKQPS